MAGSLYDIGDYDEGPYGLLSVPLAGSLVLQPVVRGSMGVHAGHLLSGSIAIEPSLSGGFTRIILTAATIHVTLTLSGFPIIGELWVPIPDEDNPWAGIPDEDGFWVPIEPNQGTWNG